ncbi:MAG: hypothetical protein MRJ67_02665 [Nitrospirales bacterium]|nr:hypothetical protein [Nitrospirales bacterium]MDR4483505.1 hypothetical protein [Nitrospirales bacterium]
MRGQAPDVSERHACQVFRVARSALHRSGATRAPSPKLAEDLVEHRQQLISQHPTYG